MKKASVLLVIFLSASLVYNVHSQESCFNFFLNLQPCLVEISSLNTGLKGTITYSCCSTILEVADNCPRGLQPFWLNKAEENCIVTYRNTPPPTPPSNDGDISINPPSNDNNAGKSPPQPPQSKLTPPPVPPSNGGNNQNCPDLNRLSPCTQQMLDYHGNKTPINSSCCALILDVREKCSPREWSDFAIECQNYCLSHTSGPPSKGTDKGKSPPPPPQSKQTPPPVPPSNGGNNQNCPDLNRLSPCTQQMLDYHGNKTPISPSCCALILDVREKCSPREWSDFATECQNYCLNQP